MHCEGSKSRSFLNFETGKEFIRDWRDYGWKGLIFKIRMSYNSIAK